MRKINLEGRKLIQHFEGLELKAYRDSVGILTIGFGHTGPDVTEGMTITMQKAEELFDQDISVFEHGVDSLLTGPPVSDNAFSALVSFSYNLGLHTLENSTLLRLVNLGRMNDAKQQFYKWDHAGGKQVSGLTARRRAEADLFGKPDTGTTIPTSST